MEGNEKEYRSLIIQKMTCLEKLHKNLMLQEKAIEDKKPKRLISLLNKSQKNIYRINEINDQINNINTQCFYDEKSLKINQLIKSKIQQIYEIYCQNHVKGQELVEEFKASLKTLNLGKKAILGGYLKRQQQLYGYFIDKKIGKSCRY